MDTSKVMDHNRVGLHLLKERYEYSAAFIPQWLTCVQCQNLAFQWVQLVHKTPWCHLKDDPVW